MAAEPKPVERKQTKTQSPKSAPEPAKKRSVSKKEEVKEAKCEFDSNLTRFLEDVKKSAKTV